MKIFMDTHDRYNPPSKHQKIKQQSEKVVLHTWDGFTEWFHLYHCWSSSIQLFSNDILRNIQKGAQPFFIYMKRGTTLKAGGIQKKHT